MLQAKDNSKDSEAGDPNGVYAGPVFAGVCVSVGLVTLVFALYLFLSEMKTYASKTRVGRQLSGAANYAKKSDGAERAVRTVFDELDIVGKFRAYEDAANARVLEMIAQVHGMPTTIFTMLLAKIYKRNK